MNNIKNNNELIKHSAAIHISADLTLLQRNLYNVLLLNAFPRLKEQEVHTINASEVCRLLGSKTRNYETIKEAFRQLRRADVEWNIFHKVGESEWSQREWTNTGLLAHATILHETVLEYSYSYPMRQRLRNPAIYARLDLEVQNKFSSKYSTVMWEFFVDTLGARRNFVEVTLVLPDLRRLMGMTEGDYKDFRVFKRSALMPALNDVNEHSGVYVEATFIREGRSIARVKLSVERRNKLQEQEQDVVGSENGDASINDAVNVGLLSRMQNEFALGKSQSSQLLREFDESYIEENLDLIKVQIERGGVRSVAGYTYKCLKEDIRPKTSSIEKSLENKKLANDQLKERRALEEIRRAEIESANGKERNKKVKEKLASMSSEEKIKAEKNFADSLIADSPHLKSYRSRGLESKLVEMAYYEYIAINLLGMKSLCD